ncbi:hypothetical protein [Rhodanobacter sp. MP7CTX1]|uniref:ComEC/Rec2 family competence protein n=1 Tax=Rhodanobacter sp. MP7CTX1 TaxID=2723084 RepID=UPI001609BFEE|nr:hypothetical protein [Rhodanobacter sp. MP7CTX1]MBB6188017.1 beta-lactamase superfamily II metal-dependent hydrolase [Rhodanobacter sp. MP7CTX1]
MGMQIEALQADEGDALLITLEGDVPRTILIDGGLARTGEAIAQIFRDRGVVKLDLLIVTHIDRDHIEGILKLLDELPASMLTVDQIWFNGYRHLRATPPNPGELGEHGALMGNRLESSIYARSIPWNKAFSHGPAARNGKTFPVMWFSDTSRITLIGPTTLQLEALAPSWEKECEKAGIVPGQPPAISDSTLVQHSSSGEFDFDALASAEFKNDHALANLSSIVVLIEHGAAVALFGGDACARSLTSALEELAAERGAPLHVDLFKVPHHGSASNLSMELLTSLQCTNYVISSSGARFGHPDDETLARIVAHHRALGGPLPTIWFNYLSARTRPWCDQDRKSSLGYEVVVPEGTGSVTARLG